VADIIGLIYEDHDWLRRRFFLLDDASSDEELEAIWSVLAIRLDTHADAEETVFYPELLDKGHHGDPEDETEDAIDDHNKIRDAVRDAAGHAVGTKPWWEAVGRARTENGKHLDEEEREAMPDFVKSASPDLRHELALRWLRFYADHPNGRGIDGSNKDAGEYIEQHT
jgi:hypothetical protein